MNDDLDRLLIRADDLAPRRRARVRAGAPAFVGQVASSGSNLAAGKFCLVTPVEVAGSEAEGAAGTFAILAGSVPVYVIGTAPANGEKVLVEWSDYRWVTEKQAGSSGGGGPIVIPGCLCQGTPATLSLTVTYGVGEDSHTYSNAYQNCTLEYRTTPRPTCPSRHSPAAGYYSSTAWVDDQGFLDYFRLTCFASQYTLGFGQNNQGLWQAPGQIYNWSMGGREQVNLCDPFTLAVGRPQSGIFFNGKIVVSG